MTFVTDNPKIAAACDASGEDCAMPRISANHERVIKIFSEQLGIEEGALTPNKDLVTDFGADSLDTVELCMAMEDEFGLEISDEDAEKVKTVQDAFDLIDRLVLSVVA